MTGGKGAALLAVLLLGCCACAPNSPPPAPAPASPPAASTPAIGEEPPGGSAGLTYTNLAGEAAAGRVRDILTGAGVPAEAVDTAMDWVADYNRCMAECPAFTLAEDFTTLDGTTVDYGDYPTMSREWYRKNGRDYHDILCRILAFQLDRHSITVEKPVSREAFDCYDSETAWLYTDGDILFGREKTEEHRAYRPFPLLHWEEETVADYFTLFNPVPIQGEPTPEAMLSAVREEWQSRGISFREGGCTLITFWTEYDGRICASHAAVLAEAGEKLLLFEKTNPESPYSAALFSSAQEVKGYLYDMMALDYRQYDMEVGPFLILQNDQPL